MRTRDLLELLVLAAIWGGSFLFMRVAAPEFGPVPLVALRVGIAALCLVPFALVRARGALRGRAVPVAVVGVINSALPFSLLAFATLSVTAGLASILNATSPLWGALVAHLWLKDRLTRGRVLGLALGLAGVTVLFWGRASFKPGGSGLAVIAALAATLSYGVAASYTKRRLTGANPLAVAAWSQFAAAVLLAPGALLLWPAHAISLRSWGAVLGLGVACTGFAYVIYYRLIAHIGPARAIAVTFLVPPFAIAWGGLFLGESVSPRMIAGALVVLAGTALTTGVVRFPMRAERVAGPEAVGPEAPRRAVVD
jgi:drug/metabolite transporter (DMT)-like permease